MKPSEAVPSLVETPPGHIVTVWVIYDHPTDAPDAYVLRPQFACRVHDGNSAFGVVTERPRPGYETVASPIAWYAADPDNLRAIIPAGCFPIPHLPGEDAAILESWI